MNWFPKQRVVVPVDFSDKSLAAVDSALDVAASAEGVHVVHVLSDLSPAEPGEIWQTVDQQARKEHATKHMRESLADAKYNNVTVEILFGDPGHEIAEYAKRVNADLIVLPSHGRTGLKRLLIGSVAERVVRLSHCPVMVLRD